MDTKQRWGKGLELMRYAKQRARKVVEGDAKPVGRPRARRMVHDALHEALAGLAKA